MPMITAFNRQQLAAVRGMRKQSEIRAILGIHGIEHKLEIIRDRGPAVKLADGSILKATHMFYIYVHKKDLRKAKYIVRREIKNRSGAM